MADGGREQWETGNESEKDGLQLYWSTKEIVGAQQGMGPTKSDLQGLLDFLEEGKGNRGNTFLKYKELSF